MVSTCIAAKESRTQVERQIVPLENVRRGLKPTSSTDPGPPALGRLRRQRRLAGLCGDRAQPHPRRRTSGRTRLWQGPRRDHPPRTHRRGRPHRPPRPRHRPAPPRTLAVAARLARPVRRRPTHLTVHNRHSQRSTRHISNLPTNHPRSRPTTLVGSQPSTAIDHVGKRANHRPSPIKPVGWPEGVSPSGSHRSRREPLGSPGSCHPVHQTRGTEGVQAQCANMRGYRKVIPCQHSMAFFTGRSRLYLLRIQRTR